MSFIFWDGRYHVPLTHGIWRAIKDTDPLAVLAAPAGDQLGPVVNDLAPPHAVQSAFNMLITGIGHLFGFGGPPPMISR